MSPAMYSVKLNASQKHKRVRRDPFSLVEWVVQSFVMEHVIDVGVEHPPIPVVSHMTTVVHTSNLWEKEG